MSNPYNTGNVFQLRQEEPSNYVAVNGCAVSTNQCFSNSKYHTQTVSFVPQSGYQGIMSASGAQSYIDIQVQNATIDQVKFIALEMNISNNSGTGPLELLPPWGFISSNGIECRVDGNVVQNWYPESMAFSNPLYLPDEARTIWALITGNVYASTWMERNTAGTTPTGTLATGASQYYYLPLMNSLFEVSQLPLCAVKSSIVFRFYFNPFAQCVATTNIATSLQVNTLNLIVGGTVKGSLRNIDTASYDLNSCISISYCSPERFSIPFGSVAANTSLKGTLNSLATGVYSQLQILYRAQQPSNEQQFQWSYTGGSTYNPTQFLIAQATLNDSNSRPYGIAAVNQNIAEYAPILMASDNNKILASTFPSLFSFTTYNFGDQQWYDYQNGCACGLQLNNSWNFNILTNPNYTTRNTEVLYIAQRIWSGILSKDGKLVCTPQ